MELTAFFHFTETIIKYRCLHNLQLRGRGWVLYLHLARMHKQGLPIKLTLCQILPASDSKEIQSILGLLPEIKV